MWHLSTCPLAAIRVKATVSSAELVLLQIWVHIPVWHTPGSGISRDRLCGQLGLADSSKRMAQVCIPTSNWKVSIVYINKTLVCFLMKHTLDKHFLYQMTLPGDVDVKHFCHFLRTKTVLATLLLKGQGSENWRSDKTQVLSPREMNNVK